MVRNSAVMDVIKLRLQLGTRIAQMGFDLLQVLIWFKRGRYCSRVMIAERSTTIKTLSLESDLSCGNFQNLLSRTSIIF